MTEQKLNKPEDLLGNLPTIGGDTRDQELIKKVTDGFIQRLDPIMKNLGQAIAEVQQRLVIIEEIINGALVDILTERVAKKLKEEKE